MRRTIVVLLWTAERLQDMATVCGNLAFALDADQADVELDVMALRDELDDEELVAETLNQWQRN